LARSFFEEDDAHLTPIQIANEDKLLSYPIRDAIKNHANIVLTKEDCADPE
jgi:hypothetical protein